MHLTIDTRVLGYGGHSGVEEYAEHIIGGIIARAPHDRLTFFHNGVRIAKLPSAWTSNPNASVTNWHIPNKLLDVSFGAFRFPRVTNTDVVFSPHFNIIETGISPHVITFHDLSFVHHPDFFPFRKRLWHSVQAPKTNAERAAHLIAVSEYTKYDLVTTWNIPKEKISVIYSGIDTQFRPIATDDSLLREWKKQNNVAFPYLLYLGTLEPRKNITGAIRAFNILKASPQFRDLRLVLAGAPGWLYASIVREAAHSPYRQHIIFWGPVKTEERVLLYNGSEAFVYPSFFEGFGLPPLEAQACGIPAVVADRTALPEILGGGALYVNPWRTGELADALAEVITNEGLRRTLRDKGLENAKRFSWERAADQTVTVLRNYADRTKI
ncbi:MAG: glycosyltransferase family 1 protein [bacterium]|nr:glycosyltransferase family 1 protein [bacterium]